MIPRRRTPPSPPATDTPTDAPATAHHAVDWDFMFTNGRVQAFSIIDDDPTTITEMADRFEVVLAVGDETERWIIFKSQLDAVRRAERTWTTPGKLFTPPIALGGMPTPSGLN